MASYLFHLPVSASSVRSTCSRQPTYNQARPCVPRLKRKVGVGAASVHNSSSLAKPPRTVAALATPASRGSDDVAQVPEIMSTAPTQQDKRADIPEHMAADVGSATQLAAQEESPADRIGSNAAAAEKAPDSDVNQDYEEPLAGEGASAAD